MMNCFLFKLFTVAWNIIDYVFSFYVEFMYLFLNFSVLTIV